MKKVYFFLIISISIAGCKTKKYSYQENPGDKIVFGEGGGFAGAYDQYTYFDNGQLFHQMGFDTTSNTEISVESKKYTKRIFKQIEAIGFNEIQFDEPGNMYRFIELHGNGIRHKVQWSLGDEKSAPIEVVKLYSELIKHTLKDE